ncbi:50S ribosomal protein L15 [bacterium HR39]|nr:50S ribosomal protein L15 [bacterium HR39]
MRLNELRPKPGSTKEKKRRGQGPGSGLGKTAGRGHKGQKARAGGAKRIFEGGQMPIYRRLPKRGFTNPFKPEYAELNLDRLQQAIDRGRLDPSQPIDGEVLVKAGVIRRVLDGVRLLGRGELRQPVTIRVAGASRKAIELVERVGGTVIVEQGAKAQAEQAAPSA